MNSLLNLIQSLVSQIKSREDGQTFVEYALLIAGVSLLLIAAFSGLPAAISNFVNTEIVGAL